MVWSLVVLQSSCEVRFAASCVGCGRSGQREVTVPIGDERSIVGPPSKTVQRVVVCTLCRLQESFPSFLQTAYLFVGLAMAVVIGCLVLAGEVEVGSRNSVLIPCPPLQIVVNVLVGGGLLCGLVAIWCSRPLAVIRLRDDASFYLFRSHRAASAFAAQNQQFQRGVIRPASRAEFANG